MTKVRKYAFYAFLTLFIGASIALGVVYNSSSVQSALITEVLKQNSGSIVQNVETSGFKLDTFWPPTVKVGKVDTNLQYGFNIQGIDCKVTTLWNQEKKINCDNFIFHYLGIEFLRFFSVNANVKTNGEIVFSSHVFNHDLKCNMYPGNHVSCSFEMLLENKPRKFLFKFQNNILELNWDKIGGFKEGQITAQEYYSNKTGAEFNVFYAQGDLKLFQNFGFNKGKMKVHGGYTKIKDKKYIDHVELLVTATSIIFSETQKLATCDLKEIIWENTAECIEIISSCNLEKPIHMCTEFGVTNVQYGPINVHYNYGTMDFTFEVRDTSLNEINNFCVKGQYHLFQPLVIIKELVSRTPFITLRTKGVFNLGTREFNT